MTDIQQRAEEWGSMKAHLLESLRTLTTNNIRHWVRKRKKILLQLSALELFVFFEGLVSRLQVDVVSV